MSRSRFYGKYRGVVTDNHDPLMQGRLRARVPAVFGDQETGWALPCTPYGGKDVGFFFIPPVGSNVWIEFEGGSTEVPIWSGCFWGPEEAPAVTPEVKVIKTGFATMIVKDLPGAGEITIECTTGSKIVMNTSGIQLVDGAASVKLTPAAVSINDGALEVI